MGAIYKRGNVYWIKYYRAGKPYYESSKSTKESAAKKLLKLREGHVVEGKFQGLKVERITFEELSQDFVNDYKVNAKKSLDRAKRSARRLEGFFEGMKAINITTDAIKVYILARQKQGVKNATINRELAALKRMFNLAARETPPKVHQVPYIPHLKENKPRSGYFEHEEYVALRDALQDFFKPVVIMAYYTGMRKGEIISLKWTQIDFKENKIVLEAGTTKNDKARVVFMDGELYESMVLQKTLRDTDYPKSPWVFVNPNTGDRIKEFRGTWDKALKEAKLEGKLFHDFRRTAVRNMVRAGVPERVAMMIPGH